MKRLVLITYEEKAKKMYLRQLNDFFEGVIQIDGCCVGEHSSYDLEGVDIVLLSFADITHYVSQSVSSDNQIVYISRSFAKEKMAGLNDVKNGEDVGLVDYSEALAYETVGILNSCGYNNLNYHIVSPENGEPESGTIKTVITTENSVDIPSGAEKVIDIGWYMIGWTTFAEIARRLDILDDKISEKLHRYSQIVSLPNQGVVDAIKYTWTAEKQLAAVVESMSDTIVLTDLEYNVVQCNRGIGDLLSEQCREEGRDMVSHMDQLAGSLCRFLTGDHGIKNEIFTVQETGKSVIITKKTVILHGEPQGYLFVIKNVTEIQRLENDYRIMQAKKGFYAKYSFEDIMTVSPKMKECITICKKIARTDLAILITGESGVGKEMFAQSIHNYSGRKEYPFVAVNCAALPKDLLESELFGFEEGSFTGAKKGGKKGLFELAHKGTIFLDEVGEMPVSTQAKLLRVLQEKQVMRVGGISVTPVDVRVISASNVNFTALFENHLFRRDLYYRLNNAKVKVPPLMERREDIPLLCEYFCRSSGMLNYAIDDELKQKLKTIRWDGNVRELKNCIEYMMALCEGRLILRDLPAEYLENEEPEEVQDIHQLPFLPEEAELARAIINNLKQRQLGRRRLQKVLREQGMEVSEYKIKKVIEYLKAKNLI